MRRFLRHLAARCDAAAFALATYETQLAAEISGRNIPERPGRKSRLGLPLGLTVAMALIVLFLGEWGVI